MGHACVLSPSISFTDGAPRASRVELLQTSTCPVLFRCLGLMAPRAVGHFPGPRAVLLHVYVFFRSRHSYLCLGSGYVNRSIV